MLPAATGLGVCAALLLGFRGGIGAVPLAIWSLCAFVLCTVVQEYARAIRARTRGGRESALRALGTLLRKNQRRYGGYIVHVGAVAILFGIGGAVARLALYENDRPLAVMAPEKRQYFVEQQPASIPAVYSTLGEDFYVVLTAIEPNGSATLKIYRNPLVNWLWIGGVLFVVGAIVLLWPHPPSRRETAEG